MVWLKGKGGILLGWSKAPSGISQGPVLRDWLLMDFDTNRSSIPVTFLIAEVWETLLAQRKARISYWKNWVTLRGLWETQ